MSTAEIIRATLRKHNDGLTLIEIAEQSGSPYRNVHRVINNMADAYIDRWQSPASSCPYQAVWCVVEVPENCPHPTKEKNGKRTESI